MNIDELMEALDDYREAKDKLAEMQSEYTGYSPGYHLASWYERVEVAKAKAEAVLEEYISIRIAEAIKKLGLLR